jgi:hypothetical protein
MTSVSVSTRMAREDVSVARDVRWQRWRGDRSITAALAVAAVWI